MPETTKKNLQHSRQWAVVVGGPREMLVGRNWSVKPVPRRIPAPEILMDSAVRTLPAVSVVAIPAKRLLSAVGVPNTVDGMVV
jgi:hypothetical protein